MFLDRAHVKWKPGKPGAGGIFLTESCYDSAQICLNGHVVNPTFYYHPELSRAFCQECGASTITRCPHCGAAIPGKYFVEGVADTMEYACPTICPACQALYPWTRSLF